MKISKVTDYAALNRNKHIQQPSICLFLLSLYMSVFVTYSPADKQEDQACLR